MEKEKPDFSGGDEGNNESSSGSDSGSDSDESSTDNEGSLFDGDQCERNRERCIRDLCDLERQFHELKERFYKERASLINVQLQQVRNGTATEYLKKLTALEDTWRTRNEVADVLRRLQLDQLNTIYDGECSALGQHHENSKRLLYEQLQEDIENRIAKLETDKRNADINLELWLRDSSRDKLKGDQGSSTNGDRGKRPSSPSDRDPSLSPSEKRRKPTTVSGPYVIYMLKENDILDDWNVIRRAALQADYYDRLSGQAVQLDF